MLELRKCCIYRGYSASPGIRGAGRISEQTVAGMGGDVLMPGRGRGVDYLQKELYLFA